jgi:hypothetical protein
MLEEDHSAYRMREIHLIFQETNTILHRIMQGYPMKAVEEPVDVLQTIKEVQEIFLPIVRQESIQVDVKGSFESQLHLDGALLKFVLYNIFYRVIKRAWKTPFITIEVQNEENTCCLVFTDNGYDLEDKMITLQGNTDILFLEKPRLIEFSSGLGWAIEFQNDEELCNRIILQIPLPLAESQLSDNIVPLFKGNRSLP